MTMHAGLRLSFQRFYAQSGRADLVDQVPEVESQDAAYARWQDKTADRNVVEQVEARYREALGLENRAMARLTASNKRLLSRVGAVIFTFLAAYTWLGIGNRIGNSVSLDRWLWWAGEAVIFTVLAFACVRWVYKDLTKFELKRAIVIHESLFGEHPDFANAACRVAYDWEVPRSAEKSLDAAVRASEADPEFEMPYFCAGLALKMLGRSDEAAAAYRKVIALNPRFAAARDNLGLVLVDKKDFEGAVEQFTAMLRDFPDARNATANLSLAEKRFTREGHTHTEFQELVRQVIGHAPDALQLLKLLTQGGR